MPLLIGDNLVVSMHYTLTDDNGAVLDSSDTSAPLAYLHGAGNIIPGLEKALVDKVIGDSLRIRVEPAEGYGEIMPELIQVIGRDAFRGVENLEEGMIFESQGPDGGMQRIVVRKVEGDDITIDANHPLAGVVLHFDVEIVGIREATQEEIAHGHLH